MSEKLYNTYKNLLENAEVEFKDYIINGGYAVSSSIIYTCKKCNETSTCQNQLLLKRIKIKNLFV